MNNKQIGTEFEREVVEKLSREGYWAHFITPDNRGAQPFDVIAVKDGVAIVGDCKTCKAKTFSVSRLEDNQIMAFKKWELCGNRIPAPIIFVKHNEKIHVIPWNVVFREGKVKINDFPCWE